jgi:site-specific DNA-methyltransferase (adenine-specific)
MFFTWATPWLGECWRIARDGAPLLLFTDWRQLPSMTDALQGAGWFWLGVVVWNKRDCRPNKGRFRQQSEFVLFGSKDRFRPAHDRCLPGVFDRPVDARHKYHLTGKPVPLLRDLLDVVREGGIVLDPFIGSGTTAVAALETGRRCIGIELSDEYVEIARERCEKILADVA